MEKPFIHCCISQTVPHEQGASAETRGLGYLRKDGWKESAYFKYSASCNVVELLLRRLVCALTQFTHCSFITAAVQETGMWLFLWMEGPHMLLPFWNYQLYFALCMCACLCVFRLLSLQESEKVLKPQRSKLLSLMKVAWGQGWSIFSSKAPHNFSALLSAAPE